MFGSVKTFGVLAVAVMPGGLLFLMAWILGRVVRNKMQESTGAQGARLVRAVAAVRWRDVWSEARHAVEAPVSLH
jgi:hypothetical protein